MDSWLRSNVLVHANLLVEDAMHISDCCSRANRDGVGLTIDYKPYRKTDRSWREGTWYSGDWQTRKGLIHNSRIVATWDAI
jgi:hypothetical protein